MAYRACQEETIGRECPDVSVVVVAVRLGLNEPDDTTNDETKLFHLVDFEGFLLTSKVLEG